MLSIQLYKEISAGFIIPLFLKSLLIKFSIGNFQNAISL